MEAGKECPAPDSVQERSLLLQQAFRNISLKSTKEDGVKNTQNILLGRVFSTRTFRRYSIQGIVRKSWKLKAGVSIGGGTDNIFRFLFECKDDKDFVFKHRPWSLDGAHLILKEWQSNLSLSAIKFDTTTMFFRVHGLPPTMLNRDNGRTIGSQFGVVYETSVSVVRNLFLHFRVDILVCNPLPAGFF